MMKVKQMILAAAMCSLSSGAWASGFALSGKTASNMGNGFSGTATMAEDASVVATNPAAMQDLDGQQFSVMLGSVMPNLRYKDKASNTGGTANTTVTDPHYIPNLYYVNTLSSDVRFGFGIYAPFGLGLDYDNNWVGRYTTTSSDLKIINFSPAISFKTSPQTSLAFGVDMQYLNATLENAVDFGTICYGYQSAGIITSGDCATTYSMVPNGSDGSQKLTGTNWALGYTIGLTHDFDEASRFGLTFHSATRHDVKGNADFTLGTDAQAIPELQAIFTDTDGNLTLILPETLSLGYRRIVSSQLQMMVDATWTRWSRYDELVVDFANSIPTSRTEQNWKDVWRLSVGANYQMDDTWLLRGGLSYDQSPVPNAEHRSARIPDGDRTWLTLGARAKIDSNMDVDLALAYAADNKYDINTTNPTLGHNINGEYTSSVLYAMAQLNWKF
jgi:long-chain fatty acid transport protein